MSSAFFCLHKAELTSALKSRLLAGYVYIPPQTPALDKGGACGCSANNPAEGRRVDRVNRVDGIASLDGVDMGALLDGAIGNASLDGRDYQMSNE